MKKKLITLSVLVLGTICVVILLQGKPAPEQKSHAEQERLSVAVVSVQPADTLVPVLTQGTALPRRDINLIAKVSGEVIQVADNFVSGGFFKAGEELLRIEDADYQIALIKAEANEVNAEGQLATEEGLARQAGLQWRDLGSQQANDLFLRKPQLAAAKANVKAAEADKALAKLNLERTRILSPFDATVAEIKVDQGQYVTPGVVLARLYDSQFMRVRLPLTDRQLSMLDTELLLNTAALEQRHLKVKLIGEIAGVEHNWSGKIIGMEAGLDVNTRLHYVIAEIENSNSKSARLPVGLFVQAEIEARPTSRVISVPNTALVNRQFIWTVNSNDVLEKHTVKFLKEVDSSVLLQIDSDEVLSVVIDPLMTFYAGEKVSVSNTNLQQAE